MIKYIIRSSYKRGQIFTPVKSHSNTVLKYETSQNSTYSTQLRKANIFRLSNFKNFAFFKTNYMRCRRKLLQNFTCPAAYFCLPWAIRELDMLSHAVQQKHMYIIIHGIYKIPFNILQKKIIISWQHSNVSELSPYWRCNVKMHSLEKLNFHRRALQFSKNDKSSWWLFLPTSPSNLSKRSMSQILSKASATLTQIQ